MNTDEAKNAKRLLSNLQDMSFDNKLGQKAIKEAILDTLSRYHDTGNVFPPDWIQGLFLNRDPTEFEKEMKILEHQISWSIKVFGEDLA